MTKWEITKWFSATCFLFATFILFSPRVAAVSPIPWAVFLVGNVIWTVDAYKIKSYPWVSVGSIFCLLDVFLIYSRIVDIRVLEVLTPILDLLEKMI